VYCLLDPMIASPGDPVRPNDTLLQNRSRIREMEWFYELETFSISAAAPVHDELRHGERREAE